MFGRYIDPEKFNKNPNFYKKIFLKEYDYCNVLNDDKYMSLNRFTLASIDYDIFDI